MDYRTEYKRWLKHANVELQKELESYTDKQVEDSFYRNLAFGTGGLRGTIGAGTNRMNILFIHLLTEPVLFRLHVLLRRWVILI